MNLPEFHPTWWATPQGKNEDGYYMAKVMGGFPYTGRYPEFFNYVLKLEAPGTSQGYLEMAVKL
jgi:hypothetical protein